MSLNTAITSVQVRSEPVEEDRQQEIGQPTSMENQQEDQRNTEQTDPILKMSGSTKNQLIVTLTGLSTILLCTKPISEDFKQRAQKKIDDSMLAVLGLSPFPSSGASDVFEVMLSDKLVVELPKAEVLKVVGHLMAVKEAVQFDVSTTSEIKRSLATENRRIIIQLLDTPGKEQSDESDGEKNNDVLFLEQPMVNTEISSSNEELDKLKAVVESQKEQISSLAARIDEKANELEVEKVVINGQNASFKFEIVKVSEFLNVVGNLKYSDRFWCKGMQWSIYVKTDKMNYLGFFLRCHNDDPNKWSCHADGKLILFNSLSKNPNSTWPFSLNFENTFSLGPINFISYNSLKNEKSDYITDDKIVVGVELNAGPVIRM